MTACVPETCCKTRIENFCVAENGTYTSQQNEGQDGCHRWPSSYIRAPQEDEKSRPTKTPSPFFRSIVVQLVMVDDNEQIVTGFTETTRSVQRQLPHIPGFSPNDILVGRGFQYEGNPGNMIFYQTVDASLGEYFGASTKREKTALVRRIYRKLIQTRRFLKYNPINETYVEINQTEARQKISHALRYRRKSETPSPAPVHVSMPLDNLAQGSIPAHVPAHRYFSYEDRAASVSISKRSCQGVVENTLASPLEEDRLDNDGFPGSPLFSEAKLQDALGIPGELEIATLQSLEEFSTFGGTVNESLCDRNVYTTEVRSPPKVPDAIVLNDSDNSTIHQSIGEEHTVAPFYVPGSSRPTSTSTPTGTSGHHEQLSHDASTSFPSTALGDGGYPFGKFVCSREDTPEFFATRSPIDL